MGAERETAQTREELRLAIALSGGGVRAAAFHLGVLQALAVERLLEQVAFVSTVSGGSLGTGLVYSISGNRWPSSELYISRTLPEARRYLTRTDLQSDIVARALRRPWLLLSSRANVLAESIRGRWQVTAMLGDIPTEPRWVINATTYETGKRWYFVPQRMGDYQMGYVLDPVIPLAEAMAASAAYPGLIGPLVLDTACHKWHQYIRAERGKTEPKEPELPRLHLWDGGVYDNLGVEALFKSEEIRYREEYNFLIVSDASKNLKAEEASWLHNRALRLVSIAVDQIRSLRSRELVRHFRERPGTGVYLKMGRDSHYILGQACASDASASALVGHCMPPSDAQAVAEHPTALHRLEEPEFDRICRHGFEVTCCTLCGYCPKLFTDKRALAALGSAS